MINNERALDERIRGAFLGLACGDALGAPAEFKSQADVKRLWGRLTEMVGGGMWAPGEWTDDTGMALCVAEGCFSSPEDPVGQVGLRFLNWQKPAKDVGSTISAAISAFRGNWHYAARKTPQAKSGKAAGNGSLMRTLPVALIYNDSAQMLRQSAHISSMTHWDAQAEICCALYCVWIEKLLKGEQLHSAWSNSLDYVQNHFHDGVVYSGHPSDAPLPSDFWTRLENLPALKRCDLQPSGYAGYVVECLEAAVWCCFNSDNYEEAVVKCVNLAGEADTIAAVAGGAAGAHWGYGAIPNRWLEKLFQRQTLEDTAQRMVELRRHLAVYARPKLPPFTIQPAAERMYVGRNPLTAWDVRKLADSGITHILDLRESHEWSPPRFGKEAISAVAEFGIWRENVPIRDMRSPSEAEFDSAHAFLSAALSEPSAKVFIHCRAGRERTGAVVTACYARNQNISYEEALSKLRDTCPLLAPFQAQIDAAKKWLSKSSRHR